MKNSDSCKAIAYFTITFISKMNTSIMSVDDGIETDVFYNCAEQNFKYQITDYYNGPNFNLIDYNTTCN